MAFTYIWSDLTTKASELIKGKPINWLVYCDMVSSEMYTSYPWRDALQTIAAGSIPLVDGVQDYSVPPQIYRLTKADIVRTDQTPNEYYTLNIEMDLDVDLVKRAYTNIRAVSRQAGAGQLRLESAIEVPSGVTLELQGEYQVISPKITALTNGLWFQDHYASVALKGLMYWGYHAADDARAGTAQANNHGEVTYTGMLAQYMAALKQMSRNEEYGANETYYPSEPMGADRDSGYALPRIFGSS